MIGPSSSAWQLNIVGNRRASLQPTRLDDMQRFNGQSEREGWTGPPPYTVLNARHGFKDWVNFNPTGAFVVSIEAKAFIEKHLLTDGVEFLSFGQLSGRDYYLLNVTRIVDAVDFDRSDISFASPQAQGTAKAIVLKDAVPANTCFFKLERLRSDVFIQDEWAARLATSGLTGFGLTRLETDVFKMILRGEDLNEHPLLTSHYTH